MANKLTARPPSFDSEAITVEEAHRIIVDSLSCDKATDARP